MKSKTILTLILLVICVVPQSFSQDFWEEIEFPYGTSIFSIAVDNQSTIYVGGGNGVYSTSNFGGDWEYHGLDHTIYSIACDNELVYAGYRLLDFFTGIWRSDNGGSTWDTTVIDLSVNGNVLALLAKGDTIFASTWDDINPNLLYTTNFDSGWVNILDLENHEGEYVSDIVLTDSGDIYASLMTYYPQRGGVLKTNDLGLNWDFTGLLNHMISSLAINSNNDVFAGAWGGEQGAMPGLYVLRNGYSEWDTLIMGPQVDDLVVNSEDHIYFSSSWPNGVVRSVDNGESFEVVNDGLPSGPMGYLTIDNQGYLYVTSHFSSNFLAKSINPTVSVPEVEYLSNNQSIILYPNPAENQLNFYSSYLMDKMQVYQISIINCIGQLFLSQEFYCSINNIKIDVNNLKSGLYFVNVSCEEYSTTRKLIKN